VGGKFECHAAGRFESLGENYFATKSGICPAHCLRRGNGGWNFADHAIGLQLQG
jgi:hypothetical protein